MKKIVLITGCTKGLGRSLVTVFQKNDWKVVGCGRSKTLIEELNTNNPNCFSSLDVSNPDQVDGWQKYITETIGNPSLIINNASIINPSVNLWELSHREFSDILGINVMGSFNIIKSFLPHMLKDMKEGIICNISSYWGSHASPKVASYCATKFAIEGLTRALAKELPSGFLALNLDPGSMKTDMLKSCASEESYNKSTPTKNVAEEIYSVLARVTKTDSGTTICIQ